MGYKVSMDKFYEIVTGDKEAFYKMCIELPTIISETSKERFEILTKMIKEELKDK
ncbi:MAG: Eco47II family restriction endonuclease [Clostridia bacterium]|nr:Eco47II family restriction endonuclease [Clostridia bacterium]